MMLSSGQLPLEGEIRLWFREGLKFSGSRHYEQAIARYDQVLKSKPDWWEVWYERGIALECLGFYQEAISNFDRALQLEPEQNAIGDVWHSRGRALHYGLGHYDQALAAYERSLNLQPMSVSTWLNKGNAFLYGLNQPQQAMACYDQAASIDPGNDLVWRNRGNALTELGAFKEAASSYDRALTINPADQATWQARNFALSRLDANKQAPITNPTWYGQGYWEEIPSYGEDAKSGVKQIFDVDNKVTAAAPPIQKVPMVMVKDAQGTRKITLGESNYSIGRDPSCDICLQSQYASRRHAVLKQLPTSDGNYAYEVDDGNGQGQRSTNGLIVNGRKCRNWALKHEDLVVFGPDVWVKYLLPEGQPR